jgi:voltage-gated potassium channel
MMAPVRDPFRRVRIGLAALVIVLVAGTVGYMVVGFGFFDAIYQTVVTVTTVGYGPQKTLHTAGKIFTIVLILGGVGTALYSFSVVFELLVEGHMRDLVRRRTMERNIARMSGHVVVCGWGRVGREVARFLAAAGREVVVVDRDAARMTEVPYPWVVGDVTEDETLIEAGLERATTLVAALDTDADNLYVTVAGRSMLPDLQIIARARNESSEPKLRRAGADRVVNPQQIGGDRMAAFVTQPHVVDFVDIVMHDGSLEFRLEELPVSTHSPLTGNTLRAVQLRDATGALILAIRRPDGTFATNPSPELTIEAGDVLIGVGTAAQLESLARFAAQA